MIVRISIELDDGAKLREEVMHPLSQYLLVFPEATPIVAEDGLVLGGYQFKGLTQEQVKELVSSTTLPPLPDAIVG